MEYMLLKDGSVRVYDVVLISAWKVWDELLAHDGIAYYWCGNKHLESWFRIDTYTQSVHEEGCDCLVFREDELPDVIKLAQMLG